MKQLFIVSLIFLLTLRVSGQVYTDVKQLTDAGVNLSPQDLLSFGIGNCDLELIKSALAKGADLNKDLKEGSYRYPLTAAIHGAADTLLPDEESFIASQIRDYGSAVFSGRTLKELRRDYVGIVRFLLENGAKPDAPPDFSSGGIPLLRAADYRDIEVIKLLLDFKADPNIQDSSGNTALLELGTVSFPFSWPYKNTAEVARLLISKGAKVTPDLIGRIKDFLNVCEVPGSPWRDFPFYNDLINSLKNLIDFCSKRQESLLSALS